MIHGTLSIASHMKVSTEPFIRLAIKRQNNVIRDMIEGDIWTKMEKQISDKVCDPDGHFNPFNQIDTWVLWPVRERIINRIRNQIAL